MASATQLNFIKEIAPLIRTEAIARGYLVASPIIAQATVESFKGTGLSSLARIYHNYFGMKCGSKWTGRSVNMRTGEEYTPGTITQISANFRAYDDMTAGVRGYFEFISTARYANLKTAHTPKEYLERIKADGYATSSTYVQTNLDRIRLYNLAQYDKGFGLQPAAGTSTAAVNPYRTPEKPVRKGQKGDDVRWVQWELVRNGYMIKIDGIFGPKTDACVLDFQLQRGLQVDGIVGPQTRRALIISG